jgi:hypothetical protein
VFDRDGDEGTDAGGREDECDGRDGGRDALGG